MLILGIDPGLRDLGWAQVDSRDSRVRRCGHVSTEAERTGRYHLSQSGRKVYDIARGDTQRRLLDLMDLVIPVIADSDLVVVEWSSASGGGFKSEGADHGSARAALFNAAAAAAAVGCARAAGSQVLMPAPVTWRAALGYARDESALHARLHALYPRTAARFTAGRRRHVFDAIGLALFGRSHATNLFTHNHATETTTP